MKVKNDNFSIHLAAFALNIILAAENVFFEIVK